MTSLRLNASFAIPPHVLRSPRALRPDSRRNPSPGFAAQTRKPSIDLPILDTCHCRPRPPGRQVILSLRSTCSTAVLTWSTLSPMYSCACRCPQVSVIAASHPASLSLSPVPASVLHRSQSLGTDPHDLHLRRRPLPPSSTLAHHKPRDTPHLDVAHLTGRD